LHRLTSSNILHYLSGIQLLLGCPSGRLSLVYLFRNCFFGSTLDHAFGTCRCGSCFFRNRCSRVSRGLQDIAPASRFKKVLPLFLRGEQVISSSLIVQKCVLYLFATCRSSYVVKKLSHVLEANSAVVLAGDMKRRSLRQAEGFALIAG